VCVCVCVCVCVWACYHLHANEIKSTRKYICRRIPVRAAASNQPPRVLPHTHMTAALHPSHNPCVGGLLAAILATILRLLRRQAIRTRLATLSCPRLNKQTCHLNWICCCCFSCTCICICVCICVFVCVYMYLCTCICIHVYVFVYLYVCICICICVYLYLCICLCLYVFVYLYLTYHPPSSPPANLNLPLLVTSLPLSAPRTAPSLAFLSLFFSFLLLLLPFSIQELTRRFEAGRGNFWGGQTYQRGG